jgi:hypothetical protein
LGPIAWAFTTVSDAFTGFQAGLALTGPACDPDGTQGSFNIPTGSGPGLDVPIPGIPCASEETGLAVVGGYVRPGLGILVLIGTVMAEIKVASWGMGQGGSPESGGDE